MNEFFSGFDTSDEQLYLLNLERRILEANLQVARLSNSSLNSQTLSSIIGSGKFYSSDSLSTLDPFPSIYASTGNLYAGNQIRSVTGIDQIDFPGYAVATLGTAFVNAATKAGLSQLIISVQLPPTVGGLALEYSLLTFDKSNTWSKEARQKGLDRLVGLIKNSENPANMVNFLDIVFHSLSTHYVGAVSQGLTTLKPNALAELLEPVPAALNSLLDFAQNQGRFMRMVDALPYDSKILTELKSSHSSPYDSVFRLFNPDLGGREIQDPMSLDLFSKIYAKVLTFIEVLSKVPNEQIDADDPKTPKEDPLSLQDYAAQSIPRLLIEAKGQGVTDSAQIAYILASVQAESEFGANMIEDVYRSKEEGGNIIWKGRDEIQRLQNPQSTNLFSQDERNFFEAKYGETNLLSNQRQLGNDQTGDGFKYRGMGYIQITGKKNYERFGTEPVNASSVNNIINPDKSAQVVIKGMKEGSFTQSGKGLSSFIHSDVQTKQEDLFVPDNTASPFVQARKIVNPGQIVEYQYYRETVDKIANNALNYWEVIRGKSFT